MRVVRDLRSPIAVAVFVKRKQGHFIIEKRAILAKLFAPL
jgi:hypothetical protein